jgi:osmoprotectant transport system substrate-binding protein
MNRRGTQKAVVAMRRTAGLVPIVAALSLAAACGGSSGGSSASVKNSPGVKSDNHLVVLQDDKHLQNSDNIIAVVRTKVAKQPLMDALSKVDTTLTQDDLTAMNKRGANHDVPATIAKDYVSQKDLGSGLSGGSGKIVVGAANFSENEILANLYVEVLKKAGYSASVKNVQSREVYEPALEHGQLDVMPEYAATLTEFLNTKDNGPNAKPLASPDITTTVAALKTLGAKHGLTPLDPSTATDENAFAVRKDFAEANHLTKLSDLANYHGKLVLGGPPECPTRPFCELGLKQKYGITFTGFKALDAGGPVTVAAIRNSNVQIGLVFSSDPVLAGS